MTGLSTRGGAMVDIQVNDCREFDMLVQVLIGVCMAHHKVSTTCQSLFVPLAPQLKVI